MCLNVVCHPGLDSGPEQEKDFLWLQGTLVRQLATCEKFCLQVKVLYYTIVTVLILLIVSWLHKEMLFLRIYKVFGAKEALVSLQVFRVKKGKSSQGKWCRSLDAVHSVALRDGQSDIVESFQLLKGILFRKFLFQCAQFFHMQIFWLCLK